MSRVQGKLQFILVLNNYDSRHVALNWQHQDRKLSLTLLSGGIGSDAHPEVLGVGPIRHAPMPDLV